ncbi:homing endonuclease associated repeat-containing protein [Aneurinibacillus aneurinilyticus]|uniref:homing endonuclease associated repeat-containing protein n=1 Tax=Aneurinibacillus aneurinilyticus TaxID=1391 RepID=UPI003523354F
MSKFVQKYSDEDLLQMIRDKANELGRTPRIKEIEKSPTIIHRFSSWKNALKHAGLIGNEVQYSDDELIDIIHNWIDKHNKIPSIKEWDSNNTLPSTSTYRRRFDKTWSEILFSIGLKDTYKKSHYRYKEMSDTEILAIFKKDVSRIYADNGEVTKELYETNKSVDGMSISGLKKRFNKNWNDLLLDMGIPKERIYNHKQTRDELIQILKDVAVQLDKTPSLEDLERLGYKTTRFTEEFDRFTNALLAAGLSLSRMESSEVTETKEELLQMYIDFSQKIGKPASAIDLDKSDKIYNAGVFKIRFNGMIGLKIEAGFNVARYHPNIRYSKKGLERVLVELYSQYKRRLTVKELKNHNLCNTTILKHFKTTSMKKVWEEVEDNIVGMQIESEGKRP